VPIEACKIVTVVPAVPARIRTRSCGAYQNAKISSRCSFHRQYARTGTIDAVAFFQVLCTQCHNYYYYERFQLREPDAICACFSLLDAGAPNDPSSWMNLNAPLPLYDSWVVVDSTPGPLVFCEPFRPFRISRQLLDPTKLFEATMSVFACIYCVSMCVSCSE
jgi:hypothetical protein